MTAMPRDVSRARSASSPSTTATSREECDVVVVGSGPCGAVVAYELAAAGKRVVLLRGRPAVHARRLRARRRALDGAHDARGRAALHARLRDADDAGDRARRRLAGELGDLRTARPDVPLRRVGDAIAELSRTTRRLDPHYDAIAELPRHRADARRRAGPAQPALPRRLQGARLLERAVPAQRARLPRQRRVLHRLPRARQAVDGHLVRAGRDRAPARAC